ncbi:hypothetical protein HJC23_013995 [Cyclotella cryptica]|uniref:hydroxyacylglutathione hydrolase n=1 Tax=Cyclotella cryptica TaxID=29204 RepID=A0ABD3NXN1_9STRA|eukprot:CCRYP_019227-RA/>CCRYP_019227-RA protein AED:0.08 eAED:0.08 QI:0/0.5/0.33/1/1/1/3/608/323
MVAIVRHTISFTAPLLACRRASGFRSSSFASAFLCFRSPHTALSTPTSSTTCRRSWSYRAGGDDAGGSFEVVQFPCLADNYGYLIHDQTTGETAAIDTPCAASYRRELDKRGWKLTLILNTHKHHDHVGGNLELKTEGVTVYGPACDGNIPGMDVSLKEEDVVRFGNTNAKVIDVGGHTIGHIAFYFPAEKTAFVGDSLFSLGCGRMFEGSKQQFWSSLQKLRNLPDDTLLYCAHEYTESNAKFAMSVEPGNVDLMKRVETIKARRARGEPTVPSMVGDEKLTNPFLRGDLSAEIRKNVGASVSDSNADVFGKIRREKDNFSG